MPVLFQKKKKAPFMLHESSVIRIGDPRLDEQLSYKHYQQDHLEELVSLALHPGD